MRNAILRAIGVCLGKDIVTIPPQLVWLVEEAITVTRSADKQIKEASGEFKRHWVLSKLLKMHPEAAERDVALAIELALRKR